MATAVNKGWDFIKEGKTYELKNGDYIREVEILEDNSTDSTYIFKFKRVRGNRKLEKGESVIHEVQHSKNLTEEFEKSNKDEMMQFYPKGTLEVNFLKK